MYSSSVHENFSKNSLGNSFLNFSITFLGILQEFPKKISKDFCGNYTTDFLQKCLLKEFNSYSYRNFWRNSSRDTVKILSRIFSLEFIQQSQISIPSGISSANYIRNCFRDFCPIISRSVSTLVLPMIPSDSFRDHPGIKYYSEIYSKILPDPLSAIYTGISADFSMNPFRIFFQGLTLILPGIAQGTSPKMLVEFFFLGITFGIPPGVSRFFLWEFFHRYLKKFFQVCSGNSAGLLQGLRHNFRLLF